LSRTPGAIFIDFRIRNPLIVALESNNVMREEELAERTLRTG
jgi:hypothetical protein